MQLRHEVVTFFSFGVRNIAHINEYKLCVILAQFVKYLCFPFSKRTAPFTSFVLHSNAHQPTPPHTPIHLVLVTLVLLVQISTAATKPLLALLVATPSYQQDLRETTKSIP